MSMSSSKTGALAASLAVLAGLTVGASPALADHDANVQHRSFAAEFHLDTPAVAPVPHVCVEVDGAELCTPDQIPTQPVVNFRVAVEFEQRSAAPPDLTVVACPDGELGGGLRVEALGSGIDRGSVTVTNLDTGQRIFEHHIGKLGGNRQKILGTLCAGPA